MRVECQKCGMEYVLDETLVATYGTSVRCSQCGDVFKVFPKSGIADSGDEWIVRRANGKTFTFKRMGVLQQWISQGKIFKDDVISREGHPAKRIGDIEEMASFFSQHSYEAPVASGFPAGKSSRVSGAANRSVQTDAPRTLDTLPPPPMTAGGSVPPQTLSNQPSVAQTVLADGPMAKRPSMTTIQPGPLNEDRTNKPTAPMKHVPRSNAIAFDKTLTEVSRDDTEAIENRDPDLSQIPASRERESWDGGREIETENPAWAENNGALRHYDDDIDLPLPRRKTGRWIALGLVLLVLAVGAYVLRFERARFGSIFDRMASSTMDDRYNKFFDRGMESFLLDSDSHYRQADREFQKVLALEENHVPTLVALAEMYAVWAQYVRDSKLDLELDLAAEGNDPGNHRELDRLKREFEEKLTEAARWAEQASSKDKESPAVSRAMADVKRLQGNLNEARLFIERARSDKEKLRTEYVSVLINMDLGKPVLELERRIDKVLDGKPIIRAMYRKARFAASRAGIGEAKSTLEKLFYLNSDHLRARDLAARLDDKKTVTLIKVPEDMHGNTEELAAAEEGIGKVEAEMPQAVTPPKGAETEEGTAPATVAPSQPAGEDPVLGGGSVDSMLAQAGRLQERGRTKDAVNLFDKVLAREPSNVEALSGVAYGYLDMGNSGKALASFRRAVQVNPSFGPALLGLAGTFKSLGQKEQALKYYKKYLEVKPNGGQAGLARRNIAALEQELGSKPATEPEKDSATQTNPTEATGVQPSGTSEGSAPPKEPKKAPDNGVTNPYAETTQPEKPPSSGTSAPSPDENPNPPKEE